MPSDITYLFEGDTGYLHVNGKIVAASTDLAELERLANDAQFGHPNLAPTDLPPTPPTTQTNMPCVNCGGRGCPQCGAGQNPAMTQTNMPYQASTDEPAPKAPTHVVTPNGLRGQIIGKAKGLWSDEITVRLENGRVATYEVVPGLEYKYETDGPKTKFAELQAKLDEIPGHTRASMVDRIDDLKMLKRQATSLAQKAPYVDLQTLSHMVIVADHEIKEAVSVIDAMDSQEPTFTPNYQVVDQASLGGGDASWLEDVLAEATQEAMTNDFNQLMDEGPEELVAGIETPVLPDQEAVGEIANSYVSAKTIGLDHKVVSMFREAFLQRVNQVRVKELQTRQERKPQRKQASMPPDSVDESLFL